MASYEWPRNVVVRRMTPRKGNYTGARGLSTLVGKQEIVVTRKEQEFVGAGGGGRSAWGTPPSPPSTLPRRRGAGAAAAAAHAASSSSSSKSKKTISRGKHTAASRDSVAHAHAAPSSQRWGAALSERSSRYVEIFPKIYKAEKRERKRRHCLLF